MNQWMKKTLACMLVGAVCLLPAAAAAPSSWAAAEIEAATQVGLVWDELTQDYQTLVTRQQFAGLAVRLIERATGSTLPVGAIDTFSDCTDSNVRKAYAVGIVEGTSPGIFSPQDPLTREQLAVILAGALKEIQAQLKVELPSRTANISQYNDGGSVSSWAKKDLSWMVGCGLIKGTSDTMLSPQANCTVEQSILLTHRAYEMAVTGKIPPVQKSVNELLLLIRNAAGRAVVDYQFEDLDQNGSKELIGVVKSGDARWEIWFASSDGNRILRLNGESILFETAVTTLLPQNGETHVAINFSNLTDDTQESYVFALRNGEPTALIAKMDANIWLGTDQKPMLSVKANDGYQGPDEETQITHTSKNSYLYYDGTEYKEYGATLISQQEFLSYGGASQAIANVKQDMAAAVSLDLTFYRRSNGLLYIQCAAKDTEGGTAYTYYSYPTQDTAITGTPMAYRGQMAPYFSTLPVTY